MKLTKTPKNIFYVLNIFLIIIFSCTQKKESTIVKKEVDFPSRTMKNAKIYFKEEGRTLIQAEGKLIQEYGFRDTAYTYFPKGVQLKFYEKDKKTPGKLYANKAKVIALKQWYEAKGNVVIINPEGDTLKTSEIFWDRRKKYIFTTDTTIIIRMDQSKIIANRGLEASDDLKNYTLRENIGSTYPK